MREELYNFIGGTHITNNIAIGIVEIENGIEDKITYKIIGSETKTKTYKRKIYYNAKGEPFFNSHFGRMYLRDIPRFN